MNVSHQHLFLIADIDRVLSLTGNPEDISHETTKVLQKVRSFLAEYQPPSPPISTETAQQIAQVIITEIEVKRTEWIQPLQLEINELNQRRQEILKEIRQLEVQRQEIISEFLEILMDRFHQSLEHKINKTLKDATYQLLSENGNLANTGDIPSFADISTDYLAQLHHFQQESDQILQSLDLTFRTVFESLKRDINSYENALSNGLERIYHLGQQSETVIEDYLLQSSPDLLQSLSIETEDNLTNFENLSSQSNQANLDLDLGIEVKKSPILTPKDDWINPVVESLELKEEPEIRPLLEIDINEPKKLVEELETENLLLNSEELETEKIIIPDLTFEPEISNPKTTVENILFGENSENFGIEKPLSYASLEEILFEEFSTQENTQSTMSENPSITNSNLPINHVSNTEDIKVIDSIKLLTDLLEEGALDNIDNEEINEHDQENLNTDNENLLPNLDEEKNLTPAIEKNLTPDKLQKLAQDLANFGGEIIPEESELKMLNFPSPWDDIDK